MCISLVVNTLQILLCFEWIYPVTFRAEETAASPKRLYSRESFSRLLWDYCFSFALLLRRTYILCVCVCQFRRTNGKWFKSHIICNSPYRLTPFQTTSCDQKYCSNLQLLIYLYPNILSLHHHWWSESLTIGINVTDILRHFHICFNIKFTGCNAT